MRVSADPTFRLIGSNKNWDRDGAPTSRLQSFETGMVAGDENPLGLMAVNRELVAQGERQDDSERIAGPGLQRKPGPRPTGGAPTTANSILSAITRRCCSTSTADCLAGKLRPGQRVQRRRLG